MSTTGHWTIYASVLWCGLSLSTSSARAAEPATLEDMLALAWKGTDAALADARAMCEELVTANPKDGAPTYALGIAQMRRLQFDPALKTLESAALAPNTRYSALRARVWLLMHLKRYDAALAEIDSVVSALPAVPSEAEEIEVRQTLGCFGRLVSYGQHVVENPPAKRAFEAAAESLAEKLAVERQQAFQSACDEVAKTKTDLDTQHELVFAQAETDTAAKDEADKAKLTADVEQWTAEITKLEAAAQKEKEDANEALDRLNSQSIVMRQQYTQFSSQFQGLSSQYASLQRELDLARNPPQPKKGEKKQSQRYRSPAQIQSSIAGCQRAMAVVREQARQAEKDLNAVNMQAATIMAGVRQSQAGYAAKIAKLNKSIKNANKQLANLEKPSKPTSPALEALQRRRAALNTYQPFSPDAERQRLLATRR